MPTTLPPSNTTNAPTFFSAISLRASNTVAPGSIDRTLPPLSLKICLTVFMAHPFRSLLSGGPAVDTPASDLSLCHLVGEITTLVADRYKHKTPSRVTLNPGKAFNARSGALPVHRPPPWPSLRTL